MSIRTLARRSFATAVVAAGFLATAGAAHAQMTGTVTYTGPTTSDAKWGYSVGPVAETVSTPYIPGGMTTVKAYCVDFANSISAPTTYTAHYTSLSAAIAGTQTTADLRHTSAADLLNYRKAAFLIDQFTQFSSETGATQTNHYAALQGALWRLFTPTALATETSTSITDKNQISYWTNQVNLFAANSAAFNSYDYSRFTIVTDVRAAGKASGAGVQEFMTSSTVTPEPATVGLMAVGLVGTLVAARRRRTA